MRTKKGDELLAAANPIPDANRLETEAFSIDDVLDRVGGVALATEPVVGQRWGRSLAVAGIAFTLVLAIGTAGALLLRGDSSIGSDQGLACGDHATDTTDSDGFFGSSAYNPFIGIHQSLVSNSGEPVLSAQVNDDLAATDMYFRLLTLETYDGSQFFASRPAIYPLDDLPWIDPCHAWNGPTTPATVDVEIGRLRMDWLPAPATPTAWRSSEGQAVWVRRQDAALTLDGGLTHTGMRYSIDIEIPKLDLSALIADADGGLTAVFAAAAANGETLPSPPPAQALRAGPADPRRHTSLPTDGESRAEDLRALAEAVTGGAESPFERGLYLEAWFLSDAFAYSTEVKTGLEANTITTWLLDPESPTYHLGYAEHFATAMAVVARSLEIPSRLVLGFAPGELSANSDSTVLYDEDAHAWVELWIPQHGWLAFDPTPRPTGDTTPTYESIGNQLGFDLVTYLSP